MQQLTSHWMWFVFPQHEELGRSAMAQRYGIASKEEAQAYWQHPVLGARLRGAAYGLNVKIWPYGGQLDIHLDERGFG